MIAIYYESSIDKDLETRFTISIYHCARPREAPTARKSLTLMPTQTSQPDVNKRLPRFPSISLASYDSNEDSRRPRPFAWYQQEGANSHNTSISRVESCDSPTEAHFIPKHMHARRLTRSRVLRHQDIFYEVVSDAATVLGLLPTSNEHAEN